MGPHKDAIYKTPAINYDGELCNNSWWLLAVNYYTKALNLRPRYTCTTPTIHLYYTNDTPVQHQRYTCTTPTIHLYYTNDTPLLDQRYTSATPMTATIMSNLLQKLSIHFAHFYNSVAGVDSEQLKNIGSFKSEVSHKVRNFLQLSVKSVFSKMPWRTQ